MSKRKGAARKRRKAAKARKRHNRTPAALLTRLADALNACEQAGMKVRFRHGAAFSYFGCVLPPEGKGNAWVARSFGKLPQSPVEDDGSDED